MKLELFIAEIEALGYRVITIHESDHGWAVLVDGHGRRGWMQPA